MVAYRRGETVKDHETQLPPAIFQATHEEMVHAGPVLEGAEGRRPEKKGTAAAVQGAPYDGIGRASRVGRIMLEVERTAPLAKIHPFRQILKPNRNVP